MQVKNANKEKPGVTTTTSPHTKKKKKGVTITSTTQSNCYL